MYQKLHDIYTKVIREKLRPEKPTKKLSRPLPQHIYLVYGEYRGYSNYSMWIETAFATNELAERHADYLNRLTQKKQKDRSYGTNEYGVMKIPLFSDYGKHVLETIETIYL